MNVTHGIQRARYRHGYKYDFDTVSKAYPSSCSDKASPHGPSTPSSSPSSSSVTTMPPHINGNKTNHSTNAHSRPPPINDGLLLTPHHVHAIHIETYPTSNLFAQGHRIMLEISSSCFPHFDVNPNTPEGPTRSQRFMTANNTVFHCDDYPSIVFLPIVRSSVSSI